MYFIKRINCYLIFFPIYYIPSRFDILILAVIFVHNYILFLFCTQLQIPNMDNAKGNGSCVLMTPAIECRSMVAIDTLIDPRSTCWSPLGRHVDRYMIDTRPTTGNSRSSVDQIMCRAVVCCQLVDRLSTLSRYSADTWPILYLPSNTLLRSTVSTVSTHLTGQRKAKRGWEKEGAMKKQLLPKKNELKTRVQKSIPYL